MVSLGQGRVTTPSFPEKGLGHSVPASLARSLKYASPTQAPSTWARVWQPRSLAKAAEALKGEWRVMGHP